MATTKTYQRASDFIRGLGESLDGIQGKDVLLHSFDVDNERPFGEGISTLVTMQISTIADPDVLVQYHAWSDAIADRLNEMVGNGAELPVIVTFEKVKTRRGFSVWNVR